jgi:hypothetical protein
MELRNAEAKLIQGQLKEWLEHREYELETTFGKSGVVDATTFLAVAKRLRARGYRSIPQEDRMTIMTKQNVRFSLSTLIMIQQYCKDDTLATKSYDAMIKDRTAATANIDLEEYNIRVKTRREIPMKKDEAEIQRLFEQWPTVQKAFRMIRRWSFEHDGVRIDMSIVRSTKTDTMGNYKWQKRFRDQDIMKHAPSYEIEVELMHQENDTVDTAMKRLVRGIGEVLRGIQKNSLLIRESEKKRVIASYNALIGSDGFRGPAPKTLLKKNFLKEREDKEPNIRDGYNVTDKADGLRCLGFFDGEGQLFLIDMGSNVYRTGLKQPECRLSLIDGEWVTLTADKKACNQYLAFDIFYTTDKKDVSQLPFQSPSAEEALAGRYGVLKQLLTTWNKGEGPKRLNASLTPKTQVQVSMKEFLFGRPGDDSIFKAAARVLDTARPYYTDGLIFTSNSKPLPARAAATFNEQFKWKPPKDNTVDFLVRIEKVADSKTKDLITIGPNPDNGEVMSYKTLRLLVGSSSENSRDIVLNMLELPARDRGPKGEYKPVLFTPKEYPDSMASVCNLELQTDPDTGETYVMTEDTEEPIQDKTVIEMSYDSTKAPGWRWKPLRVRMDKTERFQRGIIGRTLNSDRVAEDVWNSIYDPITTYMIRTGSDFPSGDEQAQLLRLMSGQEQIKKQYYDRKAPIQDLRLTADMRQFHNKWIKEMILYRVGLAGTGKTLLDMACGKAQDLQIWRRSKVSFVLGADYSGENISGGKDNAYRRYMETLQTAGRDSVPPMVFVIANSARNYVNGEAGASEEDKNILRSVLGRDKPSGPIPKWVDTEGASRLKTGADCMSCMFALHYFFENSESLGGFMRNISENLKVGGYFVGCCFDGEKVFDFMRHTDKGGTRSRMEKDATLWAITKQYDEDDIPEGEGGLGLAVDVEFISIGATHREFLVPFKLLEAQMKGIGCELLSADELKKVGLAKSTDLFGPAFDAAKKAGRSYAMIESIQQFSFFNRWFIFKRVRATGALEATQSGLAALRTAAAALPSMQVPAHAVAQSGNEIVDSNVGLEQLETAANAALNSAPLGAKKPIRTVPVAAAPGAAQQTYATGELFQFFADAAEKDVLGMGDKTAGQWLAPTAPFPIEDPEDADVVYPSMDHYLAAMRYKVASDKPELAANLFGREGSVHQSILRKRLLLSEGGKKPISDIMDKTLLKEEAAKVREEIRPSAFKKYKATFNEAEWAIKKDDIIREGLRQRWETDARFRKILEAARSKGKTLLYYTPGANSTNLGGVRKNSGAIEGENRIGRIMMELAGF